MVRELRHRLGRGDQLQLHLVRAMPRDRIGHLWVLHAKSVPRNGLRERRDLERDADEPRSLLPRRAIDPFQQDESVGRMRPVFFHMRGVPTDFNEVALFYSHPHPSCSCPAQLEEIARSGAIWECPIRTRLEKMLPSRPGTEQLNPRPQARHYWEPSCFYRQSAYEICKHCRAHVPHTPSASNAPCTLTILA